MPAADKCFGHLGKDAECGFGCYKATSLPALVSLRCAKRSITRYTRKHFVTRVIFQLRKGCIKMGRKRAKNGAFLAEKRRFGSDTVISRKVKSFIIRQFQFCVFSDETSLWSKRRHSRAITACRIGLHTLPRRAKHAGALAFATASISLNEVKLPSGERVL